MNDAFDLHAIVVSSDTQVVDVTAASLKNIGIHGIIHSDMASAIEAMSKHKIDGLFVDQELDTELSVLSRMRSRRSSQRSLAIAIVPPQQSRRRGYCVADFVLDKPLTQNRVNQVLRAAYGMMLKDRLRYARLAIHTEATVIDSMNRAFSAITTNVSQSGIALQSATPLIAGETVQVQFSLPVIGGTLACRGQIIWNDKDGKAGLVFKEIEAGAREQLNCWIEAQFNARRYSVSGSGSQQVSLERHSAVAGCTVR